MQLMALHFATLRVLLDSWAGGERGDDLAEDRVFLDRSKRARVLTVVSIVAEDKVVLGSKLNWAVIPALALARRKRYPIPIFVMYLGADRVVPRDPGKICGVQGLVWELAAIEDDLVLSDLNNLAGEPDDALEEGRLQSLVVS